MNQEEYINTQQNLILLAQLITTMDLAGLLAWIGRAETVGPVVDPTLYRQASGRMADVKQLAQAALMFQREAIRQARGEERGE